MILRLVTYAGLVVRRLWSKKGILLGSFLGATLVIALLAIVPLYEDSVAAVDLLFSVRSAADDEVDLTSTTSSLDYSGTWAASNRALVNENRNGLETWYPTMTERIQSREFLFIPIQGAVDWVGLAEQWQIDLEAAIARNEALGPDEEPEPLPNPPYPRPPQEASTARIVTSPTIDDQLEVVTGEWPENGTDQRGDGMLRVALGSDLASTVALGVGDQVVLRPFTGAPEHFEIVEVEAIVQPVDPGATFWGVTNPSVQIFVPGTVFDLWATPRPRDPQRDPWLREAAGFGGLNVEQRWTMTFDRESLDLTEIDQVRTEIANFQASLAREAPIATFAGLPRLLDRFDVRKVVFGGPILAMLALVVGGALYFLVYTAALTLEREAPEIALLKSRGASAWQTVGIHLAQSVAIAALAALAAPTVARFLVGLTGRIPPLSDLTGGEPLQVAQTRSLTPFVVAGAIITFITMGLAILPVARRSVLELRALAARPSRISIWQRYYLDLFAIVLSAIILFQLGQAGFVTREEGEAQVNGLAVIAPALFLFAGALLLLRVLPFLLRFVGWVMTKFRSLALSLPGWHLGRNPIPYGRLALLVWLTTGFGAFALTYAFTLEGSFEDRAEFAAGADVRLVGDRIGYIDPPDDISTAAVYRSNGAPRLSDRRAELLAVRPEAFAEVVTWREDFGAPTAQEAFAPLRPDGAPDLGIELPADASAIAVDAVIVGPDWEEVASRSVNRQVPKLRVLARVFDVNGRPWTLAGDADVSDTAWVTSVMTLSAASALDDGVSGAIPGPVVLAAVWFEDPDAIGNARLGTSRVLVDDWRYETPAGTTVIDDAVAGEFASNGGLGVRPEDGAYATDVFYSSIPEGETAPSAAEIQQSPLFRDGEVTLWSLPARTQFGDVPHLARSPVPLNVLLDREAAGIAGLAVGDDAVFGVGTGQIPGTLTGFVELVPTMVDRRTQGVMIIDLDALNHWLNTTPTWSLTGRLARPESPDELWAAAPTDPDGIGRRLVAVSGDEDVEVITIVGQNADFSSRPVQVGLVAILFVGAFTGIVLTLAGVTGYVLLAVSRRAREMGVLRALGFGRGGVAATFAVEQLAVMGLGAIVGVAAGVGLMWVMIPFLQLGETAADIVPSVLVDIRPSALGLYVAAVGALLILSVIWATRRVSVRRMSEVLREVER
ncbi:MAG: ABC transporter permease [Acidimicrobiia bacterium]|nr:ABC transporter permease [Acidimicrobiia bacterium]